MHNSTKQFLKTNTLDKEIALEIVKTIKKATGKGPENHKIYFFEDIILVKIRGFLSDGEVMLAKTELGSDKVRNYRLELAKVIGPIIKKNIQDLLGIDTENFFFDINPEKNEGVVVLEFN